MSDGFYLASQITFLIRWFIASISTECPLQNLQNEYIVHACLAHDFLTIPGAIVSVEHLSQDLGTFAQISTIGVAARGFNEVGLWLLGLEHSFFADLDIICIFTFINSIYSI